MATNILFQTGKIERGSWQRFKTYPFYDWDDQEYQNFMVSIMRSLETRYFYPR